MRWPADVNVGTSGGARNRRAKREERNRVPLQEVQQRLVFGTVGMKLNVHRVVMVQPPAIVNRALAENGDRQLAMKRVRKEALHFPRFPEVPAGTAGETDEGRSTHQSLLGERQVFREFEAIDSPSSRDDRCARRLKVLLCTLKAVSYTHLTLPTICSV